MTDNINYPAKNFFVDELQDNVPEESISISLTTYPFLCVPAKVSYEYIGQESSSDYHFVSTPLGKYVSNNDIQNDIKSYIKNNYFLETKVVESGS